ncbi:MAG: hypothetical protein WDZ47_01190 [Bacteroidales bacterium]
MAELLQFQEKFFRFDLGENKSRDWQIKNQLEEIYENENGFPIMLALDEFQHARSLDDFGNELDKSTSKIIWQIIDSGKFQISRSIFQLGDLYDMILKFRYLLRNGVKVSNGVVTSGRELFIEKMELKDLFERDSDKELEKDLFFVPADFHNELYSMAREKFNNPLDIEILLRKLDGNETIYFLTEIYSIGNSPKLVDCSKALVFVIGNLDEAYTMSSDYNPDMNADEFYEQSLKINIPNIKQALRKRFRNEQIARLGNTHIIYPAFNKDAYKKIISFQLRKITEKVQKFQETRLIFDLSIHNLIYSEGVYPAQGTRPLFTTIYQLIDTKLGRVIAELVLKDIVASEIRFQYNQGYLSAEYLYDKSPIHKLYFKQELTLGELRKNKQDDLQAISAVHEAGHAVLSIILLKTIPEVIYSNSVQPGSGGFLYTKFKWKYVAKKEIVSRLAFFLGGHVAEKLVFGEENLTTGAREDISTATRFITEILKDSGLGNLVGTYNVKEINTNYFLHDPKDRINQDAEEWIRLSLISAEQTLKKQEVLLLKLANYLSDHRQMSKNMIKYYTDKYSLDFNLESIIENGNHLYYRAHLKAKVNEIELNKEKVSSIDSFDISLNKQI